MQTQLIVILATLLSLTISAPVISSSPKGMPGTELSHTITIRPLPRPDPDFYLDYIRNDIDHCQKHRNCIPAVRLFQDPASAVIVGSGTAAMEAVVFATRVLPYGSTILIIQNVLEETERLQALLQEEVQEGKRFQFVVSNCMDLGCLSEIYDFLAANRDAVAHTKLYVHASDREHHYIPDVVYFDEVLVQTLRRSSVAYISNVIDAFTGPKQIKVKILLSSECAQNRDVYRIPNLAPFQFGKVFGDELFKGTLNKKNTVGFIMYSGPMATLEQYLGRVEEFEMKRASGIPTYAETAAEYAALHENNPDIDPMESVGAMLKKIYQAFVTGQAEIGGVYAIYGLSVLPELGHPVNQIEKLEDPPFLWDPIEPK